MQEPNIATIASLISDPSRATILSALMSGEALPASELAYRAHITRQTASAHLAKLLDGGLISVNKTGRHRYYMLRSASIAKTLETLQIIAPAKEPMTPNPQIPKDLLYARTCYDHLAGKLGVSITQTLIGQGYLTQVDEYYTVTAKGANLLDTWQIDCDQLKKKRRKFAYACLDWSERRFHIAGSLGEAIKTYFVDNKWVQHMPHSRALTITKEGHSALARYFQITLPSHQ